MPIKLSAIAKRRKDTTFDWPDADGKEQPVALAYNCAWLTGEREADIDAWGNGTIAERNANWLANILISWDVLDDKGKPYPTTYEAIFKLDREFTAAALNAVLGDLYPNQQTGATSAGGSELTAS